MRLTTTRTETALARVPFLVIAVAIAMQVAVGARAEPGESGETSIRSFRVTITAILAPTLLQEASERLSRWFEAHGSRRVELDLSPTYSSTLRAAVEAEGDFYALSPHSAYFLINERGFRPVVLSLGPTDACVFVLARSGVRQLEDLRSQTLATASLLSATGGETLKILEAAGLSDHVEIHDGLAHDRVIMDVLSGRYTAGVVSHLSLEILNPTSRKALRILQRSGHQAVTAIVAAPHVSQSEVDLIASLYVAYGRSPEWKEFRFHATMGGFERFTLADIENQGPAAEHVREWVQAETGAMSRAAQHEMGEGGASAAP